MEFKGLKCPVCEKPFEDGEDIVVCPDCGTPHHRECWEVENHCAFEDKHGEDFDYSESDEAKSDITVCPVCKAENPKDIFYCQKCGSPLITTNNETSNRTNYTQQQPNNANPFAAAFDPMGGVSPDEDMGGVSAGDIAKYVGNNTPYFMRVFSRIKTLGKGRFSFCAFIFSGFYLLYRKMYKIGAVLSALIILLMITETYIQFSHSNTVFQEAVKAASTQSSGYFSGYNGILNAYLNLDFYNQLMITVMMLCHTTRIVIMIVVGICANRWYFKYCVKEVKKIKNTEDNPGKDLESKGGVNTALAISMGAVYAAVNIIPMFIFGNNVFF